MRQRQLFNGRKQHLQRVLRVYRVTYRWTAHIYELMLHVPDVWQANLL